MSDAIVSLIAELGVRIEGWTAGFAAATTAVQQAATSIASALTPLSSITTAVADQVTANARRIRTELEREVEIPGLADIKARANELHNILNNAVKLEKVKIQFDESSLQGVEQFSDQVKNKLAEIAFEINGPVRESFRELASASHSILELQSGGGDPASRWKDIAAAVDLIVAKEKEINVLEAQRIGINQQIGEQQKELATRLDNASKNLTTDNAVLLSQIEQANDALKGGVTLRQQDLAIIRAVAEWTEEVVAENKLLAVVEAQRIGINQQFGVQQRELLERAQEATRQLTTENPVIIDQIEQANAALSGGVTLRQQDLEIIKAVIELTEEANLAAVEGTRLRAAEQAKLAQQAAVLAKEAKNASKRPLFINPGEIAGLNELLAKLREKAVLDTQALASASSALAFYRDVLNENQEIAVVEARRVQFNFQLVEQQQNLAARTAALGAAVSVLSDVDKQKLADLKGGVTLRQQELNEILRIVEALELAGRTARENNQAMIEARIIKWKEEYGVIINVAQAIKLIEAESKGFGASFVATADLLSQRARGITQRLREIGQSAVQVGREIQIFGVILSTSLYGAIESATTTIERMRELSTETGLSYERTQQLAGAFRSFGVTTESAERGIKQLAVTLGDASHEDQNALDKFRLLGITWTDLTTRGFDLTKVSELVSDRLRGISNDAVRLDVGSKLLGRNFALLAPAFLAGSDALKQAMGNTLILTDDAAKKLAVLGQSFETLKFNIQLVVAEFVVAAGPAIKVFEGYVSDLVGWFRNLGDGTKNVIAATALIVGPLAIVGGTFLVFAGTVANATRGLISFFNIAQTTGIVMKGTMVPAVLGATAEINNMAVAQTALIVGFGTLLRSIGPAVVAIAATGLAIDGLLGIIVNLRDAIPGVSIHISTAASNATLAVKSFEFLAGAVGTAVIVLKGLEYAIVPLLTRMGALTFGTGALTAGLGSVTFGSIAAAAGLDLTAGAVGALTVAILANPIAAAIIALGTLTVGTIAYSQVIKYLSRDTSDNTVVVKTWTDTFENAVDVLDHFRNGLTGSAQAMSENADLMKHQTEIVAAYRAEIAKAVNDNDRPSVKTVEGMLAEFQKAIEINGKVDAAVAKTTETFKQMTKTIEDQGKELVLQQKLHHNITQDQLHDFIQGNLLRMKDAGLTANQEREIANKLATFQKQVQDGITRDLQVSVDKRLIVSKTAFETQLKEQQVTDIAQIQAFQKTQQAIIDELDHHSLAYVRRTADLQATVLRMLTEFGNQEVAQEKANLKKLFEARSEAAEQLKALKLAQIETARSETTVQASREELALAQQLAEGKISIGQADEVRFRISQRNHQAEIELLGREKQATEEFYQNRTVWETQGLQSKAHVVAGQLQIDHDYLAALKQQHKDAAIELQNVDKKVAFGEPPDVAAFERAGITKKLEAIDAATLAQQAKYDKTKEAAAKSSNDFEEKINRQKIALDDEAASHKKEQQEKLLSSSVQIAEFEKKLATDKIEQVQANVAKELAEYQKLATDRIAVLQSALSQGLIDEQTYTTEVKRLAGDESEFRKHLAQENRAVYLDEFSKIFDFTEKQGIVSKNQLEEYLKDVEDSLTRLVSTQGAASALGNSEVEKQIGVYEKLKQKLDELNATANKSKNAFTGFFQSFNLGAVNLINGRTGAVKNVLEGVQPLSGGPGGGKSDSFLSNLFGGSGDSKGFGDRLKDLLKKGTGAGGDIAAPITRLTSASDIAAQSLQNLAKSANGVGGASSIGIASAGLSIPSPNVGGPNSPLTGPGGRYEVYRGRFIDHDTGAQGPQSVIINNNNVDGNPASTAETIARLAVDRTMKVKTNDFSGGNLGLNSLMIDWHTGNTGGP